MFNARRKSPVAVAALIASMAAGTPSPALPQSSTCQFAVAAWLAVRTDLQEARRTYQTCLRRSSTSCTAEEGRIRQLEQQLRLLRNYVDGYCLR